MIRDASAKLGIITTQQEKSYFLKQKAAKVDFPLDKSELELIDRMKGILSQMSGVGLAASQLGEDKSIIGILIPEDSAFLRKNAKPYPLHILINPTYECVDEKDIEYDYEVCLSVPDLSGKVPRYREIHLTYQDQDGKVHQTREAGFYARVLQHEIDHLNGILISDRLTDSCVQAPIDEIIDMWRSELSEEQRKCFDKSITKGKIILHEDVSAYC